MADPKSHYSKAIQPQQPPSSVTGKHRILMTAPNFLRLLSILFSAASVAVMVTSNQTVIAAMYSNVPFISNAIMKATGSAEACLALLLLPILRGLALFRILGIQFEASVRYHTLLGTAMIFFTAIHSASTYFV
ncbi:hypothetical protein HN51_055016 [Arachis hypogaea]|uniref:Ferric reduction oxidase 8 n=1 Tax=Arachis hypogaea TaxID=3818 RepID=A0A444XMD3_ARAHY|nr:Ferric reduction oxidase 8 [Arachis hypogaea]RYQ90880.1 hypothetical protein Ahy_B09g096836 [Arachis hypogaea]